MSRVVRERALPLIALLLALVGLVSNARGSDAARVQVVAAVRAVPAGAIVVPGAVRIVSIDARDRTPGMVTSMQAASGRVLRARLARGDYLQRGALADAADAPSLGPGERAVPLSIDPSAAPPLSLLRAGAHTDVVAEHDASGGAPAGSRLIARNLTLLVSARPSESGLVVTVRAPLEVALALATAQAQSHRLRLFVRPEGHSGG